MQKKGLLLLRDAGPLPCTRKAYHGCPSLNSKHRHTVLDRAFAQHYNSATQALKKNARVTTNTDNSPMKIILATGNQHKLKEFQQILATDTITIVPQSAFPGCPEVIEDGSSFEENALKKARAIAAHTDCVAMADDSGLEVDALDGEPGIYSARYAGEPSNDKRNIALLLENIRHVEEAQRGAQFRCVIAVVAPEGRELVAQGLCRGQITTEALGSDGFGYDPVFLHEESGRTFAQLSSAEKNSISHRGLAVRKLREVLPDFLKSLP